MVTLTQLLRFAVVSYAIEYARAQDISGLTPAEKPIEPYNFDCINGCPAQDPYLAPPPPEVPTDVTNNGNYLITNCLLGQEGDLATGLIRKLQIFGPQIQKVVDSLNLESPPGYKKWFRNFSTAPLVKSIFQAVSSGPNAAYDGGPVQQPTLTCVRDGSVNTEMQQWWTACSSPNPSKRPIAFHIKGTATVMLCPRYFELPENVPSICPHNSLDLVQNQFGVFVHEFVHVYGDTADGQKAIGGKTFGGSSEYYNPVQAKRLDQFDARLNPQVGLSL